MKFLQTETLESLPAEITLVGFGINKVVFLDDAQLTTSYAPIIEKLGKVFDWGYLSKGSALLSFAVLNTFLHPLEARHLYTTFQHHFMQQSHLGDFVVAPPEIIERKPYNSTNNFKVIIQLKEWYATMMAGDPEALNGVFHRLARVEELIINPEPVNAISAELGAKGRKIQLIDDQHGVITEFVSEEELAAERDKLANESPE